MQKCDGVQICIIFCSHDEQFFNMYMKLLKDFCALNRKSIENLLLHFIWRSKMDEKKHILFIKNRRKSRCTEEKIKKQKEVRSSFLFVLCKTFELVLEKQG